jgi:hypothetical protein
MGLPQRPHPPKGFVTAPGVGRAFEVRRQYLPQFFPEAVDFFTAQCKSSFYSEYDTWSIDFPAGGRPPERRA